MSFTTQNGRRVGVLAVQGDFEAHARSLRRAGATPLLVKHPAQLAEIEALVLPGGESTTARKFLFEGGFAEGSFPDGIRELAGRGCPVLGTCAGAILLAREVTNNVAAGIVVPDPEPSLGLMDIAICRNAYGRQLSSFITRENTPAFPGDPLEMVFIRAPIIERVGAGARVLAQHQGSPVIVRQGNLLAATFHPELTEDSRIHRYFLDMIV